jgi:hypothetical protein
MPEIWIARRPQRKALYLEMEGTKKKPNLMFFLPENQKNQMSQLQLDQLVRSELEKQGITKEVEVNALIDKAEKNYESRRKVEEAQTELKRLMAIKLGGGKLMQVGFRKWKQVFYPGVIKK